MDSERIVLVACVTAVAAVVGTFVLWGPSITTRPRKKGSVIGLQNLGLTCYLNSLLQAMVSCRYFVEWLNTQQNQGQVALATKELFNMLCGKSTSLSEEEYFVSPVNVITALNRSGWKITNSQQDVHELLCNLITILEEEAHKSCIDLIMAINVVSNHYIDETPASSNSADTQTVKYGVTSIISHDSDISVNRDEILRNDIRCEADSLFRRQTGKRSGKQKDPVGRLKPFIAHDPSQSPRPSPFRGYLTNKLECTECNYKSALRYDKFDSISLHLPERNAQSVFTLNQLLNNFVKDEVISGIICDGCNKNRMPDTELVTASAIKSSRFGKLPPCLCIHIVRTSFQEYGVYKRQDYVDFPEYIAMDPYLQKSRKRDILTYKQNAEKVTSNEDSMNNFINTYISKSNRTKYLYRLKAVIVHRGSHNDGHFMTYRRGNLNKFQTHRCNESRWFLVSDTEVNETTLYNVLTSVAYVLFYEKCS